MSIIKDVHYYNNTFSAVDNVLEIDRIYLFDEDRFTAGHWDRLEEIYKSLPEYKCSGHYDVPYWFGIEGKDLYYLWISAEPSGFQLAGKLQNNDFMEWEAKFHSVIEDLPFKVL